MAHSFGMLSADDADLIKIKYFDTEGNSTDVNNPGYMVEVTVQDYPVPAVAPITWAKGNWTIEVSASRRMEPFPLPPPAR